MNRYKYFMYIKYVTSYFEFSYSSKRAKTLPTDCNAYYTKFQRNVCKIDAKRKQTYTFLLDLKISSDEYADQFLTC